MKKRSYGVLFKSVIMFLIIFLIIFLYYVNTEYSYYSVYSKEELSKFFSMEDTLSWIFRQSILYSIMSGIIYVPVIIVLEKTKLPTFPILIFTLIVTIIVAIIYIISNLSIVF